MGGTYQLTQWIMRIAYLNLLWILFTFAGGIVLGIMPATSSLFSVSRKWIMGQTEIPIFKTYWNSYKTDFKQINIIGSVLFIIGVILFLDFFYFSRMNGFPAKIGIFVLFILVLFYVIEVLYLFPTFVHYELKTLQYLKYAIILGLSHIISTIIMVMTVIAACFALLEFPSALPFFSVSIVGLVIMRIAYGRFTKTHKQQMATDLGLSKEAG
jgi:uncharacterized membrane protein YesL